MGQLASTDPQAWRIVASSVHATRGSAYVLAPMRRAAVCGSIRGVSIGLRARNEVAGALCAYVVGVAVLVGSTLTPNRTDTLTGALLNAALSLPSVWLGVVVIRRRPDNRTGLALASLGVSVVLTGAIENWGGTFATSNQWPAAREVAVISPGVWVFNLAGFFLLCLVFPDGRLPGPRWRAAPWFGLGTAVLVNATLSLPPNDFRRGGVVPDVTWLHVSMPGRIVLLAGSGLSLLAALGSALAALVVRYRRGEEGTRLQLRWMVLGAGSVPVLLAFGLLAEALGASIAVAYTSFVAAILILLPAAVTVSILKHDLFDVDRLLSESTSWLLTTLTAAGVFAVIVSLAAHVGDRNSRIGTVGAAFLVSVALLPGHRWIHRRVGRIIDRDRTVGLLAVREFVRRVRDGETAAEHVQTELRVILGDSALQVLLQVPGSMSLVDLEGTPVHPPPARDAIPLRSGTSDVGMVVPGLRSARQLRRTRELLVEVRMPIEVARLQRQLLVALDDARASRARLVAAAADERRRLERDLHDGAQQHIVTVGMRLRSIQRTHAISPDTDHELDTAVDALESVVAELRRLAHGVRPQRLDDGLDAAVRALAANCPIPISVDIASAVLPEAVMTTAYFVIAEGLTNTLKHSGATRAEVSCERTARGHVIEIRDDGVGGVSSSLVALRDRVSALGGTLDVTSPAGLGTVVRAEI